MTTPRTPEPIAFALLCATDGSIRADAARTGADGVGILARTARPVAA